jgi:RHH-type proline utilization regulon transcriptional repressor/proline dehydrogenase/delta 1-pyrroline-5-carboxylate dehydrogenase
VPADVLALLPGAGEVVGAQLVADARVAAVVFTGSTEVGRQINQQLAQRPGPIVPLIAETGGLNAMIVDSTALPEQVADDVLLSAFDSAGQRCSSLRVLFVQDDIADKLLTMIGGALACLRVGNPLELSTDIGPVIDERAKATLLAHIERMSREGKVLYAGQAPQDGNFIAPHVVEISDMRLLEREAFGPVLHVIRWQRDELPAVISGIKACGYGLTAGIHSRREGFVRELATQLPVGNLYVNRNMIGAVPGVQPFGGEGLSGTGPKAGGPHYLRRLTTERVITIDTTAAGGNASLLMMGD